MDKKDIQISLEFWKGTLLKLQGAYVALIGGGVKSYTIDDRQLTRYDLAALRDEIDEAQKKVDELGALLAGQRPRKAFGVLPRDW